jgi:hypothetical protein
MIVELANSNLQDMERIKRKQNTRDHGGRWSNHTAQLFLTWPSVSSCVRHGCHPLEKFTTER